MTISVYPKDSNARYVSGIMNGNFDYFQYENNDMKKMGMKGFFINNKLSGNGNVMFRYTLRSFTYYIGTFTNNLPNGTMVVYKYTSTMDLTLENPQITVTKETSEFLNGVEQTVLTSESTVCNFNMQLIMKNNQIFLTQFNLSEAS